MNMIVAQVLLFSFLGVVTVFAVTAASADGKESITPAEVHLAASSDELFAILGGSQCAEQLYYGPSALSTYSGNYFSTNTRNGAYPHDQWVQIVTSDGGTELFRIYWQFSTKKSLADRFINAPTYGEAVSYRVVDTYGVAGGAGTEYTMSGTWYFSSAAAMSASKFSVASTTLGFSNNDGCWGAGSGSLNANSDYGYSYSYSYYYGYSYSYNPPSRFWGVGNFRSSDGYECSKIWVNGALYGTYNYGRTFMYIVSQSVSSNTDLFAVVGGSQCAESLYYGTAALTTTGSSDGYSYYMKTNPTMGYTAHADWLQIVTDGTNELFRIYWTFSVARTLSDRFVSAVNGYGEAVSFRVVDTAGVAGYGAGYQFTYSGSSWRFSDSANMYASKFTTTYTSYGFSANRGCWGAGTGTLNANSGSLSNFWGIANIYSGDWSCQYIYVRGSAYYYNSNARSYMYILYSGSSPPSPAPTLTPTATPTASPSQYPTARPTKLNGPYELYAVVGSNACAEDLPYGPATLTETGSSDGRPMYFSTSTSSGQQPHSEWLQIVTMDGSGELFRIYWTFSTAKTLADRFVNAPINGEWVSYRVVDTAGVAGPARREYFYSSTWRFSDAAAITASKFMSSSTKWGFSADDGAWGAASTTINAKTGMPSSFWGIGNFYGMGDYSSCNYIYANGNMLYAYSYYWYTYKVYMYVSTNSVTSTGQASSSEKIAAFFSVGTITAIVVVVVAVVVLFVLAYCYRQHLSRCRQSRSAGGTSGEPAVVVKIGGFDLGDVEVQMVSGGADGAGSIEMTKISLAQDDHDPSVAIVPDTDTDTAAVASAPPAEHLTVSTVEAPSTELDCYATTTAHTQI